MLSDNEGSVFARFLDALATVYPRSEIRAKENVPRTGRIYDSVDIRGVVNDDLTRRQYDPATLTSCGNHDFIKLV